MKVKDCTGCEHCQRRTWSQYHEPKNYHPIGFTHAYAYCKKHKKRVLEVKNARKELQPMKEQIEEIAKVLLQDCEGACTDCEYYGRYDGSVCIPMRLANSIYNAGYRKQEWISVDERLPKQWETVLVFCDDIISTDFISSTGRWYEHIDHDSVTHWMPLPETPKMKGGAE